MNDINIDDFPFDKLDTTSGDTKLVGSIIKTIGKDKIEDLLHTDEDIVVDSILRITEVCIGLKLFDDDITDIMCYVCYFDEALNEIEVSWIIESMTYLKTHKTDGDFVSEEEWPNEN